MRLDDIRGPSNPHVVRDVKLQRRQVGSDGRGAFEPGARHLQLMSDDPVVAGAGIESKGDHVDLVSVLEQAAGELPGPVLETAALGVEML